ncbi:peptidase domain-containing ABC transporter [Neolewinella lacunae]|uniref:Peptidase domain-containing ABC transporter n=1 Tax=Neolewinella lacunae TaxID=1517758 RepID=A0A923PME1_9BACT|nr:peptidase domain-containing ABC transporter [Neolewinella lacunae]MBC6993949.1 peptidase domain-containing ABC transporter [Neolewinella lacunae]MDN3634970.1 peptidase domain-containing ABC transporter [Neolewinella lacunae]
MQPTKAHVRQQDQTDCGVACLKAALNHFALAPVSFERLRELSGTSIRGTTLLGLFQAAQEVGIDAEGFEADLPSLRDCADLCILHIIKDQRLQHYVVCYGYDHKKAAFLIGDPAEPEVEYWTADKLDAVWQSKALLLLKANAAAQMEASEKPKRWDWIRSLVDEDLPLLFVALSMGVVLAVLGLATAIFSQQLLDKILPSEDRSRLFLGAGLLMLLLLARAAVQYLRSLLLLRQSFDFNLRIINFFYGRLLELPKSFFDNRKTGDLIARMNDTQHIQRAVSNILANVTIELLMVIVASGAIIWFDWRIGLVSLAWLPVFGFIVYRFHPAVLSGQQMVMSSYAANESNYVDTIQGVGVIKLHGKESFFSMVTNTFYRILQEAIVKLGKIAIRYQFWTQVTSVVFIVAIILWSAMKVLSETMTAGELIAILQMVGIQMTSAATLAGANIQLQEARVAFDRMNEFTSIRSEKEREAHQPQSVTAAFEELSVDNLRFRFPGRRLLLDGVNFRLRKGEWITIMGESGMGKSTLLQILQKFYEKESGSIKVNGIDLELLGLVDWRSHLGVLPQQVKLFNGTVLDNILLGEAPESPEVLEAFFAEYGLTENFLQLPNGLATIVGEQGVNLSGGQQQILGLARALWRRPSLLLLDEPTAALDRNSELFVLSLLKKIKSQMGILVLTHRLSTARHADQIFVLQQGRTIAVGTHDELLAHQDNLYANAWSDMLMVDYGG